MVSKPQRERGKENVGGAENPGTTTTLLAPPYHPSTLQGLVHQSSTETYNHNFFNTSKGVDNDFNCDCSSSSSADNEHTELENDVDNLGVFEGSGDGMKLNIFHLMVSQITIQKYQTLRVD